MEQAFEIDYDGLPAQVSEHHLEDMRVFRIVFSDKRKPLIVTVAEKPGGKKWWTSVPQGRQQEAEEVGKLIADYIRARRKEKG
ncbi:hypothetical protein SAMN05192574_102219 [Mucilaginibacter gossypiicola]|uniref:Uncharacterized protein n=1 Tax=Mucilaginibacter gossypiicola TaxID=551995 RepID=A0A1H8D5I4_9SPHI|nr:hypothetical protein [Mucilaginibacter gossypiicola]SEN02580.1 hypothetical protein SAMN05192574_102219 [Mucilaginibacter gossypiicola]